MKKIEITIRFAVEDDPDVTKRLRLLMDLILDYLGNTFGDLFPASDDPPVTVSWEEMKPDNPPSDPSSPESTG